MLFRALILACLIVGCGPATATSVIDDAERALLRARSADAERYAQYGDARTLAGEALRYANAASRKAAEKPR